MALFLSSGEEASNLVGPLDRAVQSLGTIETGNLLRYTPENKFSPRVITGKMAIGKLKINCRTQK
jgi:hypothetical protein